MAETIKHINRTLRIPFNRRMAFKHLREFHGKERSSEELVDRAMAFKTRGYFKVSMAQIRTEILALVKIVAESNPKIIIEIGTAQGVHVSYGQT